MKQLGNNKLEGKSVVVVSAQWCQPCQALKRLDSEGKSALNKIEEQLPEDYSFYYADVDVAKEFASKHGVRSIPAMLVFEDEVVVGKKFGVDGIDNYVTFITECHNKPKENPQPVVEKKSDSHRKVQDHNPESKGFLHDMFGPE